MQDSANRMPAKAPSPGCAVRAVKDVLDSIGDDCLGCFHLGLVRLPGRPSADEFSPGDGEIEPFLAL
jgi:hypothetical protein